VLPDERLRYRSGESGTWFPGLVLRIDLIRSRSAVPSSCRFIQRTVTARLADLLSRSSSFSEKRVKSHHGCGGGSRRQDAAGRWRRGRQFGRTWRRRGWGTHVYMHCIAKTLLTELHLAILVPASVCLRNCPAPAPSSALSPPLPFLPLLRASPSPPPSLFPSLLGIPGRVSTYARSRSIRLREIPYEMVVS